MRRIGKITSLGTGGHFLASVEYVPKIGTQLFSSSGKVLGEVKDVIGPVSSPLVLVKPLANRMLPGMSLYIPYRGSSERKERLG
ncbi:MAG: H/ACA ribonucleoprotein complex subunit GAR1 [Thermoproteota archaeon]